MADDDIEIGRRYFCREETSGEGHQGIFRIDESSMEAKLHSFDKQFFLDQKSVVLRLENNRFVTLHDIYSSGHVGSSHDSREPTLSSYNCRVAGNIAIIGRDAWNETDPIRRVDFNIAHTNELLRHKKKFNAVADAKFGKNPDPMIFEFKVEGIKVSAYYMASGNFDFKRATNIGLRYSIEFDEPATMRTYLHWVECIVQFVSAAMGHRFVPSGIKVSRLCWDDVLNSIEAQTYLGNHAITYIWPETPLPKHSLWVGHAFAYVYDNKEMGSFVECLSAWIERYDAWKNANNLMMTAFTLRDVISPERLLTACKWLEEIPCTGSESVVSAEDIEKIASAAAAKADQLGHTAFKDRVAGLIKGQLKKETNAQRFARLVTTVQKRFGKSIFGNMILDDLVQATKFRAKVAHGHFTPSDDSEYAQFVKSIYAMEALCYLLTIRDLPMKPAGAKRASGIEIVTNHRRFL
jgi:hypothetical protein